MVQLLHCKRSMRTLPYISNDNQWMSPLDSMRLHLLVHTIPKRLRSIVRALEHSTAKEVVPQPMEGDMDLQKTHNDTIVSLLPPA
jgi:hypothetical protein